MKTPDRYGLVPDWRDQIRVGDVLKTPSGDLRVVRLVSWKRGKFLRSVVLAIRRCSWTTRCYTIVSREDIGQRGYLPTGKRRRLRSRGIDAKIANEVRRRCLPPTITCCDVKGVA